MKWISPLLVMLFIVLSGAVCNKTTAGRKCYKGRLEIKGVCMNYVVKVLEGDTKALNIKATWQDEESGKTLENVFALGNKCSFPDMEEGAEFYFTLTDSAATDCVTCQAFRAVPEARNQIQVITAPCP